MKSLILSMLLTLILPSLLAQPNDNCDGAIEIKCNQTLTNQTIPLTNANDAGNGDDPANDLREDVWYKLKVEGDVPQWVQIKATPNVNSGLELELGLFTHTSCANFAQLGWAEYPNLSRCLNPGEYALVVDEARAIGEAKPAGNQFTIEVFCAPWTPSLANIAWFEDHCSIYLESGGFRPAVVWDVYLTPEPVFPEMPIPERFPGTASWLIADEEGVGLYTDLQLNPSDEGGLFSGPPLLGHSLPAQSFSLILDDGDGLFLPGLDLMIEGVQPSGCVVTDVRELAADHPDLRAFPNPFPDQATVEFQLPAAGQVSLTVFDTAGRKVAALFEGRLPGGLHQVVWEADVPEGVYFVRLTTQPDQGPGATSARPLIRRR